MNWIGAEARLPIKRADELRFWSKVWPEPNSGCYLWTAAFSHSGYPAFYWDGKVYGAHQISYIWYVGDLDPWELSCHRCDTPPCCNPRHLFRGTIADNNKDRSRKGRTARVTGTSHPQHKFTAEEIMEIRRLGLRRKLTQEDLAIAYGCEQSTISEILRGESYE